MTTTDRTPDSPPDPFAPVDVPDELDEGNGYGAWASQWGAEEPEGSLKSWISLVALIGLLVWAGIAWGWAIVVIILAIVASVFLHELGHYLTARKAGMKVTEFFIGFGPRIWSFRRGETEYGLKAIPAGAYVRIIGMHNLEEVADEDEDRTYRSKGYLRRLSVILAGPFMNIALGILVLSAVYVVAGVSNLDHWTVDEVLPGTTAAAAGIEPGDRLVTIDGAAVTDDASMRAALDGRDGTEVDFVVLRDGTEVTLTSTLGWRLDDSAAAVLPGLTGRDIVESVDGSTVTSYDDLVAALAVADGAASVEFQRDGDRFRIDVTPTEDLPADGADGFIGVRRSMTPVWEHEPAPSAIGTAVTESAFVGIASASALVSLFSPTGLSDYADEVGSAVTGEEPGTDVPDGLEYLGRAPGFEEVSDVPANRPVSIIGIVGLLDQLFDESGWAAALRLFAITNIFLGLINLVPLLPFDGGHAAVATYEAARSRRGRPYRVDMAKLLPLTYVVVGLLLMLGLTSMFLDIARPVQLP